MLAALALLAVVAIGGPSETPTDAAPDASDESATTTHAIVLDDRLDEAASIDAELQLRLSGRPAQRASPPFVAPPQPYAWVTAADPSADAVTVQIIVSDGRLFQRRVQAASDQRARVFAGTVANMLDAIEHNRLAPQETGVEAPAAPAEPPAEDAGVPETNDDGSSPAARPPTPPAASPPAPMWWVGGFIGPTLTIGAGPPSDSAGITGIGGTLGAYALHHSGLAAWLDVRAVTWRSTDVRMTQVRFAPALAYAWRPGRFELWGIVGPTISVLRVGASLVTEDGGARARLPLVGGRGSVRPAFAVYETPAVRLVLGAEVEASVAAEVRAPIGAVAVTRREGDTLRPVARAGGFELAGLLTLEARFVVARRAQASP